MLYLAEDRSPNETDEATVCKARWLWFMALEQFK